MTYLITIDIFNLDIVKLVVFRISNIFRLGGDRTTPVILKYSIYLLVDYKSAIRIDVVVSDIFLNTQTNKFSKLGGFGNFLL